MSSPYELSSAERLQFSHEDLDWVLSTYVDGLGRVDYPALRANREPLDRYIAALAETGPSTRPELFPSAAHRLAYWINAYNACVMFQVLEREGMESVHDISVRFFWWTRFDLNGESFSLYDLENDVVRAGFNDPRIHFALNCASIGCPRLPREAFQGDRLEPQLEREAKLFLADPRNVRVADGVLTVSALFDWYAEDFAGGAATWLQAQGAIGKLGENAEVRFQPWDWSLNQQPDPE